MHLIEFFAVTVSGSLYRARSSEKEKDNPSLVKIALKGKSEIVPGEDIGSMPMISVGSQLIFFQPSARDANPRQMWYPNPHEKKNGQIRIGYLGSQTSAVVALFLKESDARSCFEKGNFKPRDKRWLKQTEEVLLAIGDKHPHFSVALHPKLALLPDRP